MLLWQDANQSKIWSDGRQPYGNETLELVEVVPVETLESLSKYVDGIMATEWIRAGRLLHWHTDIVFRFLWKDMGRHRGCEIV